MFPMIFFVACFVAVAAAYVVSDAPKPHLPRGKVQAAIGSKKPKFETHVMDELYKRFMALPLERRPAVDIVAICHAYEVRFDNARLRRHFDAGHYNEWVFQMCGCFKKDCQFEEIRDLFVEFDKLDKEAAREKRSLELAKIQGRLEEASTFLELLKTESKLAREENDKFDELSRPA